MEESSFLPNQNNLEVPKSVGQSPTPPVVDPNVPPAKSKIGKYKLLIISVALVLIFLIGLALSFSFIASQIKKALPPSPTPPAPTSQPVNQEEIRNPSRYATDSAVLKIKGDLDTLDKELNSVDLNENFLRPPDIQFDESF